RRLTRFSRDWSSDVCSSDLTVRVINSGNPARLDAYGFLQLVRQRVHHPQIMSADDDIIRRLNRTDGKAFAVDVNPVGAVEITDLIAGLGLLDNGVVRAYRSIINHDLIAGAAPNGDVFSELVMRNIRAAQLMQNIRHDVSPSYVGV